VQCPGAPPEDVATAKVGIGDAGTGGVKAGERQQVEPSDAAAVTSDVQ